MSLFDYNVKMTKEDLNKFNQSVLENLHNLSTGRDSYKNILFIQTINLCKELVYLIENYQFLSTSIVLRSALESYLKLIDVVKNGDDGVNRILVSDIAEKEKLLKSGLIDSEVDGKDPSVYLEQFKKEKEKYQKKINNGDKVFKLTSQANNHSKNMLSAVMLYSKYTHSTLSMLQQLYVKDDDKLIFQPCVTDEYKWQYLRTLQKIISELQDIYNEHMAPIL